MIKTGGASPAPTIPIKIVDLTILRADAIRAYDSGDIRRSNMDTIPFGGVGSLSKRQ